MEWLIEESQPLGPTVEETISKALSQAARGQARAAANLAIRLREIVIHDTKKWFGEAAIRLDTLVIHGQSNTAAAENFYQPTTRRFQGVRDGDRLTIGDTGLLVFYGRPRHFLDISITVSRDRGDTKDLGTLLSTHLKSQDFKIAAGTILGLTAVAPHAAAVVAAIEAAAILGNLSAEVLLQVTGNTIGLYHNSYLQHRDRFGLGLHPDTGEFRVKDLSFSYEIVVDKLAPTPAGG